VRFRDESRIFSFVRQALKRALDHYTPDIGPGPASGSPSAESAGTGSLAGQTGRLAEQIAEGRPQTGGDVFGHGAFVDDAAQSPRSDTMPSTLAESSLPASGPASEPVASVAEAAPAVGLVGKAQARACPTRQFDLRWGPGHKQSGATVLPACDDVQPPPVRAGGAELALADDEAPDMEYLGCVADTYLVLRLDKDTLALLDQHAAHERVLYERIRVQAESAESQLLALPLDLPLHAAEAERLRESWNGLNRVGFALETTGARLRVKAIPGVLTTGGAREFLVDVLSGKARSQEDIWKLMACKSAVKAGQCLARSEALALLDAWRATPDRYYCPHGRPTLLSWNLRDLERLFKRRG